MENDQKAAGTEGAAEQKALAHVEGAEICADTSTEMTKATANSALALLPTGKLVLSESATYAQEPATTAANNGDALQPLGLLEALQKSHDRLEKTAGQARDIMEGVEKVGAQLRLLLARAKGVAPTSISDDHFVLRSLHVEPDAGAFMEMATYLDALSERLASRLAERKTRHDIADDLAKTPWDVVVEGISTLSGQPKGNPAFKDFSKLGLLLSDFFSNDPTAKVMVAQLGGVHDQAILNDVAAKLVTALREHIYEETDLESSAITSHIIGKLTVAIAGYVVALSEDVVPLSAAAIYAAARHTITGEDLEVLKTGGLKGYLEKKNQGPADDRPMEVRIVTKKFDTISINPSQLQEGEWNGMNDRTKDPAVARSMSRGAMKKLLEDMTSTMAITGSLGFRNEKGEIQSYDISITGQEGVEDSHVIVTTNAPGYQTGKLDVKNPQHAAEIERILDTLNAGWKLGNVGPKEPEKCD